MSNQLTNEPQPIPLDSLLAGLKAAAEPTRLRILALMRVGGDLTVKEFTEILGQSQPRVSRHLKLLCETGLIQRYPEGSWVFYHFAESATDQALVNRVLSLLDAGDPTLVRDRQRLTAIKQAQADSAAQYFSEHAERWDEMRVKNIPEEKVERALQTMIGGAPIRSFLDLGTGTARVLELFASQFSRGLGIDSSANMLSVARANLNKSGITHAHVRLGDIYALELAADSYDLVTIHQVLHFLENPEAAIREAARVVEPGGRIVIVDYLKHDKDILREKQAHRRLGFDPKQIGQWCEASGLEFVESEILPNDDPEGLKILICVVRDPSLHKVSANEQVEFHDSEETFQ